MVEVYVTSAEAEGPTTEELREKAGEKSPQTRAWEDVCLLISKMPWLFNTVLPLKAPTPLPGMQTERYNTLAVRISYEAIRDAMLDENLDKVVVIAHSQGGIITSLALDNLYATMPTQYFKKLEIYTFGSAASDFHNPMVDPSHLGSSTTPNAMAAANKSAMDMPKLSSRKPDPTYIEQHLVKYIEHYCNGHDMVPLWGVLWHIAKGTSSSYSGRVFRHENQSGHLFDQHYLESMLPLSKINDHDDPHMFLNHVCRMNTREAGVLTAATFGPNSKSGNDEGLIVATVRDLSRLWRYVDGKSP
ncbi:hypothetical protein FH972_025043 [Carpinus fangiana]|uniref:DUF676 domain-containing protein n=1 Tax=Carpinus fangiana TaxID=176857 RepID=A0A5N6L0F3_9ROSI|nr:hypothetical protein FH972_025043 [Carpinus fangiana]